jgi:hypothetical protein
VEALPSASFCRKVYRYTERDTLSAEIAEILDFCRMQKSTEGSSLSAEIAEI